MTDADRIRPAAASRFISGRPSSFSSGKNDRWFFALQPTPAAQEAIVRYQDHASARHGFRHYRIKPQNLHVSLHAIGVGRELPKSVLEAACTAAVAAAVSPFEITFDRALSFASKRHRPFVLCGEKNAP